MKIVFFLTLFSSVTALASGGGDGVPGYVISQIVNIILLFGIIYFKFGSTIKEFFKAKREDFIESVEAASRAKAEAENKKKEVETRLSDLKSNFKKDVEEAKKNAEESYRIQITDARNEALRIEKEAETSVDGEMQKAIEGLRVEAFNKSVDMAEKNLEKKLTPDQQKAWNETFAVRVKGAH